jgi:hypothetical protein
MLDIELIQGFQEEVSQLLSELDPVVEQLEEFEDSEFPSELLETFAQRIDRIMGAAKTMAQLDPESLGLGAIGTLAELCKVMGYEAARQKKLPLVPIFGGFWSETVELVRNITDKLEDQKAANDIVKSGFERLKGRLQWLKSKVFQNTDAGGKLAQDAIDQLLGNLNKL